MELSSTNQKVSNPAGAKKGLFTGSTLDRCNTISNKICDPPTGGKNKHELCPMLDRCDIFKNEDWRNRTNTSVDISSKLKVV
jgi:hypothetical protein